MYRVSKTAGAASILLTPRLKKFGLATGGALRIGSGLFLISAIINLLSLALPLSILIVYDRIVPNASYESLAVLIALLIFIAGAEAMLRICRAYVMGWSAAKFELGTTLEALDRILVMNYKELNNVPLVRQAERLKAVSNYADFMGSQSRLAIVDLPYVILFLSVMAMIGGGLALVPLIVIALFSISVIALANKFRRVLEERKGQDTRIYDFIHEILSSIHTVKAAAMEPLMLRRFERLQRAASLTDYNSIGVSAHSQTIMGLFGNVTIIAMASTGGWLAVTGNLTVGTLAACTLLAGRTIQPVVRVAGIWNEVQRTALSLQDIQELFTTTHAPEFHRTRVERQELQYPRPLELDLDNLDVVRAGRTIVRGISASFPVGSISAIAGEDGGGKSTLLRMMAGEIPPENGAIHFDGGTIENAIVDGKQIAMASASQGLFTGTILENLTLFGEGSSIEDARWAANQIGLTENINALPMGYDTPVGGGGTTGLASGFVQRLIIARALARRPGLLLLDEPQAFLDFDADKLMISGLSALRGEVTIVMATNRPSYLKMSDFAYRLHGGVLQQQNPQEMGYRPAASVTGGAA